MRLSFSLLAALPFALLACGGSTTGGVPSDAGLGADAHACLRPSPNAWAVPANLFSEACSTDSDCQAVYIGDDACEVALVNGTQNMPCPNAAIATSSYHLYLTRYDAINQQCHQSCGTAGAIFCPSPAVHCSAGSCELCGDSGSCAPAP